jgi:hypothetical protein
MIKIIAIAFLFAVTVLAQVETEKIAVPLHDPSQPPRVRAHVLSGSITVRGADVNNVVVETKTPEHKIPHEPPPARADGMRRLELPGNAGLDVSEDNNVINVRTASWNRQADLVITVPRHSSLELRCVNAGDINVEQVDGEIDANDVNGSITLKHVGGSIVAHSLNGSVLVTMDRVDPGKPMSFSTLNNDIDVTLPSDVKADVRMKTDNGEIYSDFEVKLEAGNRIVRDESERRSNGHYHVHFDHTLRGTINGGGPEFQFTSFNGHIYIRKKK